MPIRLAIVGTGMIVPEALTALKSVPDFIVSAIYARPHSLAHGQALASEYGIPTVYTDYDQMLAESDATTVYVANINSVHYEYALKALEANKHVILEKPFCTTRQQTHELINEAQRRGLFLFEAVTFLHAPFFMTLQSRLGEIGRIRLVLANYSKYSTRYDRYLKHDIAPVFQPELSGGTLMDLNVYNVNFVCALFGQPARIDYNANLGYNGIDLSGVLTLNYADFIAVCMAAKDSVSPSFIQVQGEKGWVRIEGSPDNFSAWQISGLTGTPETFPIVADRHRMIDEFEHFAKIILSDNRAEAQKYLDITLAVSTILDEGRRQVGLL